MKKLIIALGVFAAALAVNADVLYWMVADDQVNDSIENDSSGYFAYLRVNNSNDNMSYIATPDRRNADAVIEAAAWGDQFAADISGYANNSYYFYVELANGLRTDPVNYANIDASYLYSGGYSTPTASLPTGGFGQVSGTTYNVPEPTSGLLFLVGGMLLGLKRRRQQV